jgi:hypothetical protein
MSHEAEQPLEHVEHAQHASHSPFDRRVAMTMAIVAAVLAAVTLLSHREHNATISHLIESNIKSTEAADQWAFYQAKKGREHLYEAMGDLVAVSSTETKSSDAAKASLSKWHSNAERYRGDAETIKEKAEELQHESKELEKESHHSHIRADRFDLGELGVELAIILCSIAVLTKRKGFWFSGIAFGVLGAAVAVTGFFLR